MEYKIVQKTGGTVVVHIDPINKEHPKYEAISKTVGEIISQDKRINSFHELRIVGFKADRCNVVFDIVLEQDADEQETYDIIHKIKDKFKAEFPEMKAIIKAEPKYAFST